MKLWLGYVITDLDRGKVNDGEHCPAQRNQKELVLDVEHILFDLSEFHPTVDDVIQFEIVDDHEGGLVRRKLPILQVILMIAISTLYFQTLTRMENRYESEHRIHLENGKEGQAHCYDDNQRNSLHITCFAARRNLFFKANALRLELVL